MRIKRTINRPRRKKKLTKLSFSVPVAKIISAVCTIPPTDKFKHGTLTELNEYYLERNKQCERIIWLVTEGNN